MNKYYSTSFAQTYGQNDYGSCNYNQNTTGCVPSASNSSGALTNTGFVVVSVVTVACVVIVAGILVRFWRRSSKAKLQTVAAEATVEEIDARNPKDQ